ncbi:DNA processing protein [Prosthecobacter fusiformis]|uniref:DNA processing protein n=1 Tax=Prosthecobacter fusiformis TaxID=48464 RepID=A0A4R7RM75_9BACT|nr:DNA-processing protein DprA [Prosthecobacter fusiformis]TDU64054.1 DNA processing protein [Prosthecobacter fusiformis]
MTRTEAYLALNLIPQVGPVRIRRLLQTFGTPERVLTAKASEIVQVDGFGMTQAEAIAGWESQVHLDKEMAKIHERGLTLLTQEDELYPPLLKQIYDAPILLYVWGQLQKRDHQAIGVVGSRHATLYGMNATKKMSFQIAYAGYTVISGLARGIDTAAHEAALAAKGRTVAVIGSGIGKLYPPENMALAQRISENGAVISEYPVDRIADRQTFPYRNRIVAGWGSGLLVVEAPVKSGSLITAQQATEQGRTVYAVPGPIDKPTSAGCNRLIQQGAKLVMDGADVLDDLMTLFPTAPIAPKVEAPPPAVNLTLDEQILFGAMTTEELHIDELTALSGLAPGTVNVNLMRLEMKRLIRALPGRRYVRVN